MNGSGRVWTAIFGPGLCYENAESLVQVQLRLATRRQNIFRTGVFRVSNVIIFEPIVKIFKKPNESSH